MKRLYLCIMIVAVMLVIGIASYFCTKSVTENIEQKIDVITDCYNTGDFGRVKLLSTELRETWEDYIEEHIFVTDKEQAIEITLSITRIEALAEEQDDEILAESTVAKELISIYREKQALSLANIF